LVPRKLSPSVRGVTGLLKLHYGIVVSLQSSANPAYFTLYFFSVGLASTRVFSR
jgi:hypothetical protein